MTDPPRLKSMLGSSARTVASGNPYSAHTKWSLAMTLRDAIEAPMALPAMLLLGCLTSKMTLVHLLPPQRPPSGSPIWSRLKFLQL